MHQSVPAVPISPPGNCRAFAHVVSPGGGAILLRGWVNFIAARGLGICIPRGDPRAFNTGVLESAMDEFIGKDKVFVDQWRVHQRLEKLTDVFKGMFSQF